MTDKIIKTPVLIVGGGPVGLALAGDLGWRGVPCLLIERGDGHVENPKMDMVHIRTMEFCRRWGIVPWVESAGYNREHSQDYAWVTGMHAGHELGREPFPNCVEEEAPPQSPQKRERCPQNFFDPVLARHARSYRCVDIRYGVELGSFTQTDHGVSAEIIDRESGGKTRVEAQYLAACDGAGSPVREQLGIALSGNAVLTYTTNAIFECKDFNRIHNFAPAYRYIFIGQEGTWCTIVAIDGHDRYRFSFVGSRNREQMSEADIRAAIARALGCDVEFTILSTMPWRRAELIAESYGVKRVFLVGDSAHQLSPTGGFGMNTGIQEAVDIAWKLQGAVEGWGGPRLLESYEIERKPVATFNVSEAARNLARMLKPREERPPEVIFTQGAQGDQARKAYGDWYTRMMAPEWFTIGVQLGFRYEHSPIVVREDGEGPAQEVHRYVQSARPGHRAPHIWLKGQTSTLDLFGKGYVLLRFLGAPPDVSGLVAAAALRGVPLKVVDLSHAAAAEAYEKRLVLVRPDGHVAWRADAQPDDPLHVIDIVRGAV